jgi:hypothetical protein
MLHHVRGVYLNGQFEDSKVKSEDLANHLYYDIHFRPGRALFLDGKCLHKGHLEMSRCMDIQNALVVSLQQ